MRYYRMKLNTNAAMIKEHAKINLREYGLANRSIETLNNYMSMTMKNGLCFIAFREEDDTTTMAAYAYNEKKYTYSEAYDELFAALDIFGINRISEPEEICMIDFSEILSEARRRENISYYQRYIEETRLPEFMAFGDYNAEKTPKRFELRERLIPETTVKPIGIYDSSFVRELKNIRAHKNTSGHTENMVHYVISARSREASIDMTGTLADSLLDANRISSRRIKIISEIEPELFRHNRYIEEIIENTFGGIVVLDLSEKFGFSSTDYGMTCKYIEKLVKKYRKDCLFVFTYNIDEPGFSYYILPGLREYMIPVMLREGTFSRKTAISYMKELIKDSEYSQYSEQAEEYMKLFPSRSFTQTDVMKAYDEFDAWCLNRNVLKAYDYGISEDFFLDRDENAASFYEKLNSMIGLKTVKERIDDIIDADIVEKERKKRIGSSYRSAAMHMIFAGNPGTAKTTVAKLFAGIAKEKGILKSGAFVERGGMDLDGLGCVRAIRDAFLAAEGGVLFIDEAYSMKSDTAVTVLIQEMENRRDDVIVILAGYSERMKAFMEINEGLVSRIPYWLDFPDYNTGELTEIFRLMTKERGFSITEDALKDARYIFEKARHRENFGNGRYARNLLENAIQKQSVRLMGKRGSARDIRKKELFLITGEDIESVRALEEDNNSLTAREELESMIGLSNVKEVVKKAAAGFKMKKICMDRGLKKDTFSLHMVFTGNPGTAKTTVARLFAKMLKEEDVLPTGNFVEAGRADIVGDHVGATAPNVKRKFREAHGGVLFIDEAYSLCDACEGSFGDEAINTIVQEMENHRDDVIVIFAGYPDKMEGFLDRNPGLRSRIAFKVEFEDYSTDELCAITKLMLDNKKMMITDAAMGKLRGIYEKARKSSDFGNGRFVRKIIEESEMNLAQRLIGTDVGELTDSVLTTIEECDITGSGAEHKKDNIKKIGFCA